MSTNIERKYFLDHIALKRLVDPVASTRIRALSEIAESLNNNIAFRGFRTHDELSFAPFDLLVRNLIRWFQFQPILREDVILDLLILILTRRDFLRHIVKCISLTRLKKEITKIQKLAISPESSTKLRIIENLLRDYESSILIDIANTTGSFSDVDSPQFSIFSSSRSSSRASLMTPPAPSSAPVQQEVSEFWERLEGLNLDTFNGLDAELSLYTELDHLCNVLGFLRSSIEDYPPEFFLQPPGVMQTLMDIFLKVPQQQAIKIIHLLRINVIALKTRWLEFTESSLSQTDNSVKKHINSILKMLTSYFERLHINFDSEFFESNLEFTNEIYRLLFDLANFIKDTKQVCGIFVYELLNMMANIAKGLRTFGDTGMTRIHYMLCIYAINALAVSFENTENTVCENNLWEYESDVALLDGALKISKSGIYSLIQKNRAKVIKEDKELMLLLEVDEIWKPVVRIFKFWKDLTDEELIFTGLEALNTIRIHKSLELVDLLVAKIEKSSGKFNTNKELKEAAEEIFLRLLSNEIPEIRRRTYSLARATFQKKLTDESSNNLDSSLNSIIGIPLTTEIVTEILCFGFADADEETHINIRLILFGLLRAKVSFPNHWQEIANILKPILPLTTSLLATDKKLGRFAFDIFQEHSIFDDFDLNQGFARFLYCKDRETREIAKQKLLNRFQFNQDYFALVPNEFCLLQESQVTQLQIPTKNVGFDADAYESMIQVLKSFGGSYTDSDILQSLLLQFNVMMNSKELCLKSHDDNIWVYFMASLDMGFPENIYIRRHTISILYKWVVCISDFRIYLANESSVLEFLLKSLVYFQEDVQIKKQASVLLFLLLFCDFVVTGDQNISMPALLTNLYCPFKFDEHWTVSPFNKISELEQLHEAMESSDGANDIRKIIQTYLRFTFAREWFGTDKLWEIDNFYANCSSKVLKVHNNLRIKENDVQSLKQTISKELLKDLCLQLDNATATPQAQNLIHQTKALLMIPVKNEREFAEKVDQRIERLFVYCDKNTKQQKMFLGFLEIFEEIVEFLADERIVNILQKKFFTSIIMTDVQYVEEIFIAGLSLLNKVILLCRQRPNLMKTIVKSFEQKEKVYFPSKIVERFSNQLFDELMRDGKWHESGKRPVVRSILVILRNALEILPNQLDDRFLSELFNKFSKVLLPLYRSHHNHFKAASTLHVNSNMLKLIFGVMLSISAITGQLKMTPDHFKTLTFWAYDDQRKYKALPWMIIAQLTRKKENFNQFCNDFAEATCDGLLKSVLYTISSGKLTPTDQKSLAMVYSNFLDHSPPNICSSIKVVDKLLETENFSALCVIISKMVQNDLPGTEDLVTSREIVGIFIRVKQTKDLENLNRVTEQFEAVRACYKYKPLKDHVVTVVSEFLRLDFFEIWKTDDDHKKFTMSCFTMLLIMMQSENGMRKISRCLSIPKTIEQVILASQESLKLSNPFYEVMFMLKFWNSMIDSNTNFKCSVIDTISTHKLNENTKEALKPNGSIEIDEKIKAKFGDIWQKEFGNVCFAIDVVFLQVVNAFNFAYCSKLSTEYKFEMKSLSFCIISKLTSTNEHVKQLAEKVELFDMVMKKLELSLTVMQSYRHHETTKKNGVAKCQFMIKDLCILLKTLTDWNLPLKNNSKRIKEIFKQILSVTDWLDADSVLMNCFLNLIKMICPMNIGRSCVMENIAGKPLVKSILINVQALSSKPPHTDMNMALIRNGLSTLQSCSAFIDVRIILRNSKIFQVLEVLHPQIHKTRKTTWDDVTIMWLMFFEFLSRFEDTECVPHHVSLLCRLFRHGNSKIKNSSLHIIRNFSLNSSIGHVLINSEDFKQTVDVILMDSTDTQQKYLILQTLLSIASKSEQYKSKLKNSSLSRKLKDQLALMQSNIQFLTDPENIKVMNLTSMLSQILFNNQ